MTAGDLAAGLRRIARKRASVAVTPPQAPGGRATAPVSAPPPAAPVRGEFRPVLAPRAKPLFEGGRLLEADGRQAFTVCRDAESLMPELRLERELRRSLARLSRKDPDDVDHGLAAAVGVSPGEIAFLDLETTGFWGCPIFLVGLLLEEEGSLVTHQLLARDYPEEGGILAAAARLLEGKKLLVTFNGKSYDVPCFRDRAVVHGVRHRVDGLPHVDLLHPARRRYKEELPDCRLQTLEREVVGIFRTGDVPSSEIPAVYHEFAATANPYALDPVMHHSRVDLLTTARLFTTLIS